MNTNKKSCREAIARIEGIKKDLLRYDGRLDDDSGIYVLTRTDSEGFRYAYIGQARHILTRLAQHFTGYQHIDLSIKKHGMYSDENPYGWEIKTSRYPEAVLDEMEKKLIRLYADSGFQLRNKTSGSQGVGKEKIDEWRPAKTYRDGVEYGYRKASREISHLFDLHLDFCTKKNPPTKTQENAVKKFKDFLAFHKKN